MFKFHINNDFQTEEAVMYRPGQRVELKVKPGQVDVIVEYDPMMVPPIWLANDPKPRYPEELELVANPVRENTWFNSFGRSKIRPATSGAKFNSRKAVTVCR